MRKILDLALFAGVCAGAMAIFESAPHALIASLIVTIACDSMVWGRANRR